MIEEWRPVVGFEGYEVSSIGNIRSYRRPGNGATSLSSVPTYVKPKLSKGYFRVNLSVMGKRRNIGIHRLVAENFVDGDFSLQVAHKDGNALNNRADNLYWATPKQNAEDRIRHGTQVRGSRQHSAVLTDEKVLAIKQEYGLGYGTHKELAQRYGVGKATVTDILASRTWSHVNV